MSNIILLPATRVKAVEGNYKATIQQKWDGREGLGFNATLKRGNKTVADLHQDGNGGSTYVYWVDADAEEAFEEYAAEWDFTYGEEFAEEYGFDFVLTHDTESVIDTLVEEAISLKTMNASRQTYVIRAGEPHNTYSISIPTPKGTTTVVAPFDRILNTGDMFWNKIEWVLV